MKVILKQKKNVILLKKMGKKCTTKISYFRAKLEQKKTKIM